MVIFHLNLTLTRVVFEYIKEPAGTEKSYNLTLTRVVFEFFWACASGEIYSIFNFNKSCI